MSIHFVSLEIYYVIELFELFNALFTLILYSLYGINNRLIINCNDNY